jgi:hypothetical protein
LRRCEYAFVLLEMSVGVSRFEACEWLDNGRDFAGLAKVIVRVCVNVWILFERFGIRRW